MVDKAIDEVEGEVATQRASLEAANISVRNATTLVETSKMIEVEDADTN